MIGGRGGGSARAEGALAVAEGKETVGPMVLPPGSRCRRVTHARGDTVYTTLG